MIDFSNDTAQALLQQMLEQVPDTFDKRDTAPIPTALGPAAWALEGFYLVLNQVQQSAFIQTAGGQSLDNLAVIGSISRYPASPAVRLGRFNVPVPIGSRFSTVNGADSMDFTVTEADGTDSGSYLYKLTADTPGTAGNDYSGPLLPITVIPGLTSAEMTDILTPGDDTETDGALRARLITALNDRPFGGNIASYRDAILAIDGVGAVQVYPTWNGGGTVKCSVLGSDWLPASQDLVNAVQTAADPPPNQGLGLGFAPIGAQVTVTAPEAVAINIGADRPQELGGQRGRLRSGIRLRRVSGPDNGGAGGHYGGGQRRKCDHQRQRRRSDADRNQRPPAGSHPRGGVAECMTWIPT